MKNPLHLRLSFIASAVLLVTLSGCANNGYRCPLDPTEDPESSTACVGMEEALSGAKSTLRSKNSVVVDDNGKPFVREGEGSVASNLAAKMPLMQLGGNSGAADFSQAPGFTAPKVFQVWTPPRIDDRGVYHEGRNSWLATSGHWKVQTPGSGYRPDVSAQTQVHTASSNPVNASGDTSSLLRPSVPNDQLQSKYWVKQKSGTSASSAPVVATNAGSANAAGASATPIPVSPNAKSTVPSSTEKAQKSSALSSFGAALVDGSKSSPKGTDAITAPAVSLKD